MEIDEEPELQLNFEWNDQGIPIPAHALQYDPFDPILGEDIWEPLLEAHALAFDPLDPLFNEAIWDIEPLEEDVEEEDPLAPITPQLQPLQWQQPGTHTPLPMTGRVK